MWWNLLYPTEIAPGNLGNLHFDRSMCGSLLMAFSIDHLHVLHLVWPLAWQCDYVNQAVVHHLEDPLHFYAARQHSKAGSDSKKTVDSAFHLLMWKFCLLFSLIGQLPWDLVEGKSCGRCWPPPPSPSKMKLPIEWVPITVHEEEEVMWLSLRKGEWRALSVPHAWFGLSGGALKANLQSVWWRNCLWAYKST